MSHLDTVTVRKGRPQGSVYVPTSKSIAHRALICAALAASESVSVISCVPHNEDIDATLDCLAALGVSFQIEKETSDTHCRCVTVKGCGGQWDQKGTTLPCRESGSTLRFMLPLCLLSEESVCLQGSPRLLERPLSDYDALLSDRSCKKSETMLEIGQGSTISPGIFHLSGKISSQFVTGLLFALPILAQDSVIEMDQAPESRSYIDMTIAVMKRFGVSAYWETEKTIRIPGNQTYVATDMSVDGDASGAAFFYALQAFGASVDVCNPPNSDIIQGDSVCTEYLQKMVKNSGELPIISLEDCPDLGPILFATATLCRGAIFTHTARLRMKESDRVAAMVAELSKFGANIATSDDVLDNERKASLPPEFQTLGDGAACGGWVAVLPTANGLHAPRETLNGHNDHRIVMSLAILCSMVGDGCITDAHAVRKSFPNFFDCLRELGIAVEGAM
jgi:3-phosphoshikimate 1-carboxyvinyltransferase